MDPTRTGGLPPRYKTRVTVEQGGPGGPRHVCTDPPLLATREAAVEFIRGMGGPDLSADLASVVDVEIYVDGRWVLARRLQGPTVLVPDQPPPGPPRLTRDPRPQSPSFRPGPPVPDRPPPRVDVALAVLGRTAGDTDDSAKAVRAAALVVLLQYLS